MEKSSSYDELMVIHQFDRKCKLALDGEVVDYERHMAYRRKHKVMLFLVQPLPEEVTLQVGEEEVVHLPVFPLQDLIRV